MKTKSFSVSGLSAKAVVFLSAIAVFTACSVKKNAVTTTQEQTQATGSRTSMQALLSFGSILQTLDFSADSVTIVLTPSVVDTTKERGSQDPVLRITAHQPRVKSEAQSHNLVVAQQQEQDTVSIQNQANSHADVSSDTVGGATPACSTTAAIIIAILLMAIMGGVGYFAFRKTIFRKLFF